MSKQKKPYDNRNQQKSIDSTSSFGLGNAIFTTIGVVLVGTMEITSYVLTGRTILYSINHQIGSPINQYERFFMEDNPYGNFIKNTVIVLFSKPVRRVIRLTFILALYLTAQSFAASAFAFVAVGITAFSGVYFSYTEYSAAKNTKISASIAKNMLRLSEQLKSIKDKSRDKTISHELQKFILDNSVSASKLLKPKEPDIVTSLLKSVGANFLEAAGALLTFRLNEFLTLCLYGTASDYQFDVNHKKYIVTIYNRISSTSSVISQLLYNDKSCDKIYFEDHNAAKDAALKASFVNYYLSKIPHKSSAEEIIKAYHQTSEEDRQKILEKQERRVVGQKKLKRDEPQRFFWSNFMEYYTDSFYTPSEERAVMKKKFDARFSDIYDNVVRGKRYYYENTSNINVNNETKLSRKGQRDKKSHPKKEKESWAKYQSTRQVDGHFTRDKH
ncbi:MAG: hypothetical protein SFT93_05945 [Rickettsiaceae bacterium]|nr:hypothetical protein [Rickettsiaceae bacterium]